ncbi:hypothetical protein SO802_013262 [Lithocarpus litseifolius]|uniref:Serine aminopeptidase S33 domain-containing protein n=1 Tax=Lithocarpus litseifolius TaxID=425828 RepID=A0AAW2D974_9ROSI
MWFFPVSCRLPLKDSPILHFLPGMDVIGLELAMHHKALGKCAVFSVTFVETYLCCRQWLVKLIEETVRFEHALSPHKPIYLVGDSFRGCLALAVASRKSAIDLVLILSNPATSFGRSHLQPLFPILEAMPAGLHSTIPYPLGSVMGDPVKVAAVNIESSFPPGQRFERLSCSLTGLLPYLSGFDDIIPRDTLLWKLKLRKSAAAYANSRLHAVKAEVLVFLFGS